MNHVFEYDELKFKEFERICNLIIGAEKVFYNGKSYQMHVSLQDPNSWRAFFQNIEKNGTVILKNDDQTTIMEVPIFDILT